MSIKSALLLGIFTGIILIIVNYAREYVSEARLTDIFVVAFVSSIFMSFLERKKNNRDNAQE